MKFLQMLLAFLRGLQKPVPAPSPAPVPNPTPIPSTGTLLDEINKARVAHGLPPFKAHPCLTAQSQRWSETMQMRGYLGHDGMAQRLAACGIQSGGEIVAEGQRTVSEAVQAWLNSPGHATIMLGNYIFCGAGSSGVYWSALMGTAGQGELHVPPKIDPAKGSNV